ncbi:MAG: recombination-associated protein RdgC [Proteobacteria bacterium]|nr:recombination-associated protein RdgC [Pseudomonadota bacterium]
MKFKNLKIFQLQKPFEYQPEKLSEQLSDLAFEPCSPAMPSSMGWCNPFDKDNALLTHGINGVILLCLKIEEKVLPPAVLRDQIDHKVKQIEQQQQRTVYKKEKQSLKDEVYFSLLPRAFTKITRLYGYIDTRERWLVIDTASDSKAELFLTFLRKTLTTLQAKSPETMRLPTILTEWLKTHQISKGFDINPYCVLVQPNNKRSVVRCQEHDLSNQGVQYFLKQGSEVHQLGLSWREQVDFVLRNDFSLAQVSFTDELKNSLKDTHYDTVEQELDAAFFLIAETCRHLINELYALLAKPVSETKEEAIENMEEAVA